jgi:hypothetical protein
MQNIPTIKDLNTTTNSSENSPQPVYNFYDEYEVGKVCEAIEMGFTDMADNEAIAQEYNEFKNLHADDNLSQTIAILDGMSISDKKYVRNRVLSYTVEGNSKVSVKAAFLESKFRSMLRNPDLGAMVKKLLEEI